MSEEKKVVAPVEINDEDLDTIAGGAGTPIQWRCCYCGAYVNVKSNAEITAHYRSCDKSPFNPANK